MRRHRNVKVVATLGPASSKPDQIRRLFDAGVDVFRMNMSHGDHEDHTARYNAIRQVEAEVGRPIAILGDLQGPKLRVGVFADGAKPYLEQGQTFRFDLDPTPGDATRVQLPHPEIIKAAHVGATLLVNDGKIRLKVEEVGADFLTTVVEIGGQISERKGVNVPDIELPLAALSEKDKEDLEFVCKLGVDWIALSFVQRPEDVIEANDLVRGRALVMVKVEKPAAVERIGGIMEVCDGIMVARGDLGVELPIAEIPPIQKRLISMSRDRGKPVIVATQMLESMIDNPMPTRAEVTDVANAIYEGADAVMLSAESAVGSYGPEAVEMMDRIARSMEQDENYRSTIMNSRTKARPTPSDAITAAAREVAETLEVKAICCFTHSGTTARRMARERPLVPIMVLTPIMKTARKMALLWGAHCVVTKNVDMFRQAVVVAIEESAVNGFATTGDRLAITAGVPFNVPGTTNILRIAEVGETPEPMTDPGA